MNKWLDIVKLLLTNEKLKHQELLLIRKDRIQKMIIHIKLLKMILNINDSL